MIHIENDEAFPVLAILGEVDLASVEQLNASLLACASAPVLVVSLERAEFIDSTVLESLIRCHGSRNGRLVIVLPEGSRVFRLFKVTNLVDYFSLAGSRSEAFQRAATLRDLAAASFSRDGVKTPQARS